MSLPPIIGLNGVARSGKDTVAGMLRDLYGYEILSFSDVLNTALYTLDREVGEDAGVYVKQGSPDDWYVRYADLIDRVGYEEAKSLNGVRRLLQVMGTEVGRNLLGANIWVEALFNNLPKGKLVAISNVRFPNEYEAVRVCGGQVWEVTRPGYQPSNGHISDTALQGFDFDYKIDNDGSLSDLADEVVGIMEGLITNRGVSSAR